MRTVFVCKAVYSFFVVSMFAAANLVGGENAFFAQPDYFDDSTSVRSGFTLSSSVFTGNDGIVRYTPTSADDKLSQNHSADAHLNTSLWQNSGYGVSFFNLKFSENISLQAANNTNVGLVSYDLIADTGSLRVADITNEFVQVVFVVD